MNGGGTSPSTQQLLIPDWALAFWAVYPFTSCAEACPPWFVPIQKEEEFFTCAWTLNEETGAPVLLIAGHRFVIRLLDLGIGSSVHVSPPSGLRSLPFVFAACRRCRPPTASVSRVLSAFSAPPSHSETSAPSPVSIGPWTTRPFSLKFRYPSRRPLARGMRPTSCALNDHHPFICTGMMNVRLSACCLGFLFLPLAGALSSTGLLAPFRLLHPAPLLSQAQAQVRPHAQLAANPPVGLPSCLTRSWPPDLHRPWKCH